MSDGKKKVSVHKTPYGSWGSYDGTYNTFMPHTSTQYDQEFVRDAAPHGHVFGEGVYYPYHDYNEDEAEHHLEE